MNEKYNERKYKIDRIIEEYDKRRTQQEIADMFKMDLKDVAFVTKDNNYIHTRKVTPENRREGEYINPVTVMDDYKFLDNYPVENFTNVLEIR